MNPRHFLLVLSMLATASLPAQKKLISKLLHQNDSLFSEVLNRPEQFDVQVIYTQIDRNENNNRCEEQTFRKGMPLLYKEK
ncbi:MAG: hypothetical protein AAB316_09925 [Bacteroidota bacterium]